MGCWANELYKNYKIKDCIKTYFNNIARRPCSSTHQTDSAFTLLHVTGFLVQEIGGVFGILVSFVYTYILPFLEITWYLMILSIEILEMITIFYREQKWNCSLFEILLVKRGNSGAFRFARYAKTR